MPRKRVGADGSVAKSKPKFGAAAAAGDPRTPGARGSRVAPKIVSLPQQPAWREHLDGIETVIEALEAADGIKAQIEALRAAPESVASLAQTESMLRLAMRLLAVPRASMLRSAVMKLIKELQPRQGGTNRTLDALTAVAQHEASNLLVLLLGDFEMLQQAPESVTWLLELPHPLQLASIAGLSELPTVAKVVNTVLEFVRSEFIAPLLSEEVVSQSIVKQNDADYQSVHGSKKFPSAHGCKK